jgi:serine phosphatase RsbU (regulator of sigma subunit)
MAGEPFTFDRICEIVAATNGDPTEIGNSLLTQVRQHLGDQPQDDDICLISFGRVPTAQVHHKGT